MSSPASPGRRRALVGTLVLLTVVTVTAWMAWLLAADGFGALDLLMLAAFGLTTPVVALAAWTSLAGFLLLRLHDPVRRVLPAMARVGPSDPITARVAIVVPVFNEAPQQVFRHLGSMLRSLDGAEDAERFEVFVLSDSNDPAIVSEEETRFRALRGGDARPDRLHYRRRSANAGFKAGNIWEFVEGAGRGFDFMLVLDADSLMGAGAIHRLVRIMQRSPEIGILQPLIVGLPAASAFARIFQFGMRHGMRTYATGLAWWQADEGPYWGHNALVRLRPFREHCGLPLLQGGPPLGGHVLSHDQVEAVLMRRAGFEVRLLPLEAGSFEQTPPVLPAFMRRDLRWCQGNMQYFQLLALPGLRPLGRVQLLLAIMMYLNAPLWFAFLGLGLAQIVAGGGEIAYGVDPALAVGLLGLMLGMTFMPKVLGLLDALFDRQVRSAFGGGLRLIAGAAVELVFSVLIGPLLALAHTVFIGGLALGRCVRWEAQDRNGGALALRETLRGLWPQMALGLVILAYVGSLAPGVLPWALPLLLGLSLAPLFAWGTSQPWLGRALARAGLCATPEELAPPPEVRWAEAAPVIPQPTLPSDVPVAAEPVEASGRVSSGSLA